MADEEKMEGMQDQEPEEDQVAADQMQDDADSSAENDASPDEPAADDAAPDDRSPEEIEAERMMEEMDAEAQAEADVQPDDPGDSEEGAMDDLVEQQMLAELEKLESDEEGAGESAALQDDMSEQDVREPDFPSFETTSSTVEQRNLDLLLDVKLPISIELGRTTMKIKEILTLGPGSVVELKKLAGEPVDLLINNHTVAKGEVVVVDENFGLRITSLLSPEERLKSLE